MEAGKQYYKVDEMARLFNFDSARRIQQLTQDGVIETVEVKVNGRKVRRYDIEPTVQRYVNHLQTKLRDKQELLKIDNFNPALDEARKIKADADFKEARSKIEQMRRDELQGRLHRAEDVELITGDMVAKVRAELLALPGGLAKDVTGINDTAEIAGIIKGAVNELLNRMAKYHYDPKKYDEIVRQREQWMNESSEDSQDDEG